MGMDKLTFSITDSGYIYVETPEGAEWGMGRTVEQAINFLRGARSGQPDTELEAPKATCLT